MPVAPITPNKIMENKVIPDEVIEAFNDLIAENHRGSQSFVTQDAVVGLIVSKMADAASARGRVLEFQPGEARQRIFDSKWLDVGYLYGIAGWTVTYDTPSSTFIFVEK